MSKILIYWIPLLLWAFVIFGFSSQPYEKQDLRPLIGKQIDQEKAKEMLQHVKVEYAGREISVQSLGVPGFIEFFIRKGAHLTEYFILGFLIYRAFWSTGYSKRKLLVFALLLSILYAASDEFHQMFTSNRTPHVEDVVLDSIGAFLGIELASLFYRQDRRL
ncbi:MAG: VanZ family protein [Tepidibacillus sp.]